MAVAPVNGAPFFDVFAFNKVIQRVEIKVLAVIGGGLVDVD